MPPPPYNLCHLLCTVKHWGLVGPSPHSWDAELCWRKVNSCWQSLSRPRCSFNLYLQGSSRSPLSTPVSALSNSSYWYCFSPRVHTSITQTFSLWMSLLYCIKSKKPLAMNCLSVGTLLFKPCLDFLFSLSLFSSLEERIFLLVCGAYPITLEASDLGKLVNPKHHKYKDNHT